MSRLAAAALAAAALGSAVFAGASEPGPWRRLWGWGSDPARDKYEELFDSRYPSRPYDPFNRSMPFEDVQHFNRQFDLRAAGASQRVLEQDGTVTLVIEWPGSAALPLDVAVAEGLVRVVPGRPDGETPSGYRFRARRSRELSTPVPARAKASSAKISREGDAIRVAFERE